MSYLDFKKEKLIQTLLAIFGLFWWHGRNKKKDERLEEKEARKASELKKTNPEKIASILCQKYDEAEITFYNFRRNVNRLKERVITDRITEFYVLLHMCIRAIELDLMNQIKRCRI